jgi:hypothetical protein
MFYVESQSSRLTGWFPTKELAQKHCRDWPDEGMSVIPGCYIAGVVERHPPRMMSEETAKALNDHNANIAWVMSHPGNFIRVEPKEPDDVQKAWIERVKEENRASYDAMIATAFQIAFEAGMKAGEWKPFDTAPRDGSYFDAWVEPNNHVTRVYYDGSNFRVDNYSGVVWLSEIGTSTHWRQGQEGPKK